jgi:hypothetical protein
MDGANFDAISYRNSSLLALSPTLQSVIYLYVSIGINRIYIIKEYLPMIEVDGIKKNVM